MPASSSAALDATDSHGGIKFYVGVGGLKLCKGPSRVRLALLTRPLFSLLRSLKRKHQDQ